MAHLLETYQKARQALYDHVGFVEDWVTCPIEDRTELHWKLTEHEVIYGIEKDVISENGNQFSDDIYTQRFYEKHIYRGKKFTMVFVDTHTDGMKYFAFFDNSKELKI